MIQNSNNQSAHKQEPTKGNLLISEPFLPDPNFERTVILICEHNEEGSLGFVLNKPSSLQVNDAVEELEGIDQILYSGGPVQKDTLHFIHTLGEELEGSMDIGNGIYWGGNFEHLLTLVNTKQISADNFRFFAGYSGWAAGQLKGELDEESWIIAQNFPQKEIFSTAPENLWREILKNMGGRYKMYSNYPIDPRLN